MNGLGRKSIAMMMAMVFSISLATTAGAAESTAEAGMKAKVVDGQVYVSSADLVKALGGRGQYDAKTGTYLYKGNEMIPKIIERVSPSVVSIIGKASDEHGDASSDEYDLAHGTGVIIRSNGWIVTNAHVVDGLDNPLVVTSDGNTYHITKTYSDPISDIALIKINAKSLKPATFAKAPKTSVGETVIAIGTPVTFALRNTATVGVISGLNREVEAANYRLIQTDAAINPGNSGGPLFNLKGEVIGINSMKYTEIGIDNTGFSIPVETVQYVIDQYFKYGKVKRASLGLLLEESYSTVVGMPTDDPLTVNGVFSEAAKKAKIQEGDLLYSIGGTRVSSAADINELLKAYLPGQKVKLMMQSDGDIVIRTLVLGDREDFEAEIEAFLTEDEDQ
ncbi:trypsin-like peptidase domain-containing protein [Paenibacillus sp. ACRSA]|uniref:S1C family serine protease n=1 Tax=Paenibacillus sp. ACRSA TaxID=2918211 RepID=UPI001EF42E71|nr:trypsin-like peptidase domain-containing protein [Paenibacillus sp. ACRSA]MCG7379622.1 trypsin-like peptidase domain-containing protein [Paenibacillus sp. ACRSA]